MSYIYTFSQSCNRDSIGIFGLQYDLAGEIVNGGFLHVGCYDSLSLRVVVDGLGSYAFDTRCRRNLNLEVIGDTVSQLVVELAEYLVNLAVNRIGGHVDNTHAVGTGFGPLRNSDAALPTLGNATVGVAEIVGGAVFAHRFVDFV